MLLAGDIGGTKTILALFEAEAGRGPAVVESYRSQEHPSFREVVSAFLARHRPSIDSGCVGVAGPVKNNRCEATNLPWVVDGAEIAAQLSLEQLVLLNDLEALAHGVAVLRPADILELNAGAPGAQGNRAVIAAGTGLGEAGLFWDGVAHHPFASEGGHGDFAPHDELEMELLRFLLKEHDRISWERLVSGMGLVNIFRFFRDTGRETEPAWLAEAMARGDPGQVISESAGRSALCARTLELFVKLYGAEAGDLALKVMATGGVYVGGGIAPKNVEWMKTGAFLRAFTAKGRMQSLMQAIPVRLILNDLTSLLGAAHSVRLRAGRGQA